MIRQFSSLIYGNIFLHMLSIPQKNFYQMISSSTFLQRLFLLFLCSVHRVSQYICVIKTNLMHYLSSGYFVNQMAGMAKASKEGLSAEVYSKRSLWKENNVNFRSMVVKNSSMTCKSQLKSTTRTNCCIYTVYLMMMGYKYAQNMQKLIDGIN